MINKTSIKILVLMIVCAMLLAGCSVSNYHLTEEACHIQSIALYDTNELILEINDSTLLEQIIASLETLPLSHYGNPPCYDVGEKYIQINYDDGNYEQISSSAIRMIREEESFCNGFDYIATDVFDSLFERLVELSKTLETNE